MGVQRSLLGVISEIWIGEKCGCKAMTAASTRSQSHRRDPVPVAVGDG